MTGTVRMYFSAETLIEAVQRATERWRRLTSDEEADLPWSTHVLMREDGDKMEVEVVIEFDRTLVDGVTSG